MEFSLHRDEISCLSAESARCTMRHVVEVEADSEEDELARMELDEWIALAASQVEDAATADDVEAVEATLPLLRRCVVRSAALNGAGHLAALEQRVALAGALETANRSAEAADQLRTCVDESLALDAVEAASNYRFHLASILNDAGDAAAAAAELQRCLASREAILGETHDETLTTLVFLAEVTQCAAESCAVDSAEAAETMVKAEALMRRALALHESSRGEDDPETQACMSNLAGFLQDAGKLEEAEVLMRRDLAVTEHALGGVEHEDAVMSLSNLADVLLARGSETLRAEAEVLMQRCLAAAVVVHGADDAVSIYARGNVGRCRVRTVGDRAAVAEAAAMIAEACRELRAPPHYFRDDHRWLLKLDAARVEGALRERVCIACAAPRESDTAALVQ